MDIFIRCPPITSLVLGLIFGMSYQIAQAGMPAGFAGWFTVVIFGLAIGLTASGFYKFIDARAPEINNTNGEPNVHII